MNRDRAFARRRREYLEYLAAERQLAPLSRQAYRRDLDAWAAWLAARGLDDLRADRHHLRAYLAQRAERGAAPASRARAAVAIRQYARFLALERYLDRDPLALVETPKVPRTTPGVLSPAEVEALLAAPDPTAPLGLRDRALLEAFYATGARVSELVLAVREDLALAHRFLKVRGKGAKERIVFLGEAAATALDRYLKECRPRLARARSPDTIFLSRGGRRLRREDVWRLVRRMARRAGLTKRLSPHTLRHSFATHLMERGAEIRVLQHLLGHESVATTQVYTHVNRANLRGIHDRYHPRA